MTARRRVGLVDMGSNAIRTEIVEFDDRDSRTLEKHRAAVRLGGDAFGSGVLSPETIERAVGVLRDFRDLCDQHVVDSVVAVATAAAREAANGTALLERVRTETGIEVRTISGMTEAYYLRAAVDTRLDTRVGSFMLTDLGGGSVEVVRIEAGEVVAAGTFPIGAIRVLHAIGADRDHLLGPELVARIESHIAPVVEEIRATISEEADEFVATGGNIETITDLLSQERDLEVERGIQACRRKHILDLVRRLAALPLDQRRSKFKLRPDRADTIVPAGIVYGRLAKVAGTKRIVVPRVGIRSGLRAAAIAGHPTPDLVD